MEIEAEIEENTQPATQQPPPQDQVPQSTIHSKVKTFRSSRRQSKMESEEHVDFVSSMNGVV